MSEDYDRVYTTLERRKAIKDIIKNKGFTGITELSRILEKDYNISTTRMTLYKDLANIDAVSDEDFKVFQNVMLDSCVKYLNEIDNIINKSKSDFVRMKAIRAYLVSTKDMIKIMQLLRPKNKDKERVKHVSDGTCINDYRVKKEPDVEVMFDDE